MSPKTFNTGVSNVSVLTGANDTMYLQNEDLGRGSAFGFSVGKYLTDSFRLELEATKRTGYQYNTTAISPPNILISKGKIDTQTVFSSGFYDFQPFVVRDRTITPYLGGGVGISRNTMGRVLVNNAGTNGIISGNTTNKFAYKLFAGTSVSLTEQLSIDVSYQYVNLGEFKSGNYHDMGAAAFNYLKALTAVKSKRKN